MSIRRNGRWFLWICGAGAIAALVTAVVWWKDIALHYYLTQLRRDPASLPSFLDESAGATKKLAVRVFARQPLGRAVVVSLFMDCYVKAYVHTSRRTESRTGDTAFDPMNVADVENAIVGFYDWDKLPGTLKFRDLLCWQDAGQGGFAYYDGKLLVDWEGSAVFIDDARLCGLAGLLVECRGDPLDLPQYPGLRVEVLSAESAIDRANRWPDPPAGSFWKPSDRTKPLEAFVLMISRKPSRGGGG